MPGAITPEAEPKPEEQQPEGGAEPTNRISKKPRMPWEDPNAGSESAMPASEAQQKQLIEQMKKEAETKTVESGDSYWNISQNTVRGPMRKLLLTGAVVASPVVAGTVWLGDKFARKTIGKVPVVGQIYEKPRELIVKGAEKTSDLLTASVTSPAFVVDRTRDLVQGVMGVETKEAKNVIGKVGEFVFQDVIGGTLKLAKNVGQWSLEKGLNLFKGTLETVTQILTTLLTAAFTIPRDLVKGTLSGTKGAVAGGLSGIVSTAATVGLIGWGIWTYALGYPAAGYGPWLMNTLKAAWTAIRAGAGA